jgi:hypothetical protein
MQHPKRKFPRDSARWIERSALDGKDGAEGATDKHRATERAIHQLLTRESNEYDDRNEN